MFAGEKKRLTLQFENKLIGVAIDRFGQDIPVVKIDDTHFQTMVEVCVSNQFYGWLAGIGTGVEIAEPVEEREKYKQYLQQLAEML